MRPRDLVLALLVAAVWGANFVFLHIGLETIPPLLFNALRFGLAAFPAILFLGRPRVAWRWVIAVGLVLGVVKYSLLLWSIHAGMPAGLSSVLLQSAAGFTLVFGFVALGERPRRRQLVGLAVAACGIVVVGLRIGGDLPLGAFTLLIGAAAAWGVSNVLTRRAAAPDALRFMVWVSAVATGPLLVLSLVFEGPSRDLAALRGIGWPEAGAVFWGAVVSTLFGFGVWGALMRRYNAATVSSFALLVPFFGLGFAALALHERPHPTDLVGAVLVVGGVLWGARAVRTSPATTTTASPAGATTGSPTAPAVTPLTVGAVQSSSGR
ncbi:membrane protein [Longispora fulva]|uniref:O-acetylserine/cysteine efflux transporter n=1 Tax=Longispora fulva TaxID=619741 RepID=A0A8J7H4D2_9ACTN|nr:EamA family transporter [Longispora fulva]MBG6141223.1 O-acetylserine/cysteine efflux transporter [Longispora fulva]GIG62781.1 membrane protein [Longispora fulva]